VGTILRGVARDGLRRAYKHHHERRFASGKNERVPEFAADLVHLNVNVIVATGTTEIRAAKQSTTTIPIVMVLAPDPIESGLVANLSHPGGNITGLSLLAPELTGKRLELLRETVSGSSRFALSSPDESLTTAVVFAGDEIHPARGLEILLARLTY